MLAFTPPHTGKTGTPEQEMTGFSEKQVSDSQVQVHWPVLARLAEVDIPSVRERQGAALLLGAGSGARPSGLTCQTCQTLGSEASYFPSLCLKFLSLGIASPGLTAQCED